MNRLLATIALAAAAGTAQAQQLDTPQRVIQPVYQAANNPNLAGYASQYAVDENGYLAQNGYDGYPADNNGEAPQPAATGIQQVANLSYADPAQPAPTAGATEPGSYGNCGTCGSCCAASGCATSYCDPFWSHRSSVFFDWLFLKVRNDDVVSAVPQNGIGPGGVPFGTVGSNSPGYSPGFRVGATAAINRCSSIYASYTWWQAESNGSTFANPPLVVQSLVTLPQTGTAASSGTASFTRDMVRFQFADVDYRRLIAGGANWYVNYAVGARYANLYQAFSQAQVNGPTQTGVNTRIGMDGLGPRFGLLAARKAPCTGLYMYGSGFADILVGNFRNSYQQINNLAGIQGFSNWQSFRPVPILEFELGAGWISPNGKWKFSGGYYFAAWFNVVTPGTYINAVQTNNYVANNGVANNITFDGLVLRAQRMW